MGNNFLQIEPGRERSNRWRNFFATFVILSVILAVGLFSSDFSENFFLHGDKFLKNTFPVSVERDAQASVGGDVLVLPKRNFSPVLTGELISPDQFTAGSVFVKDLETKTTLYKKNPYEIRPIASITKLMSALVILERNPDWVSSTQVVVDDIPDTHMYAGDTYTFDELWLAALVGSSNKAILTLSDAVGWPREAFVERMNQKAMELGMNNSRFVDPTGLDAGNVSTASDVVLLLEEALRNEKIKQATLTKEHNLYSNERKQTHHMWSTDWLLLGWIPNHLTGILGGKTGYIPDSGYNFVMQTVDDDGHVIDVIVLGANIHEARFTEARDVAQSIFENYTWPE